MSLATLNIIIKDESYDFNFAEFAMAEELNNQLVEKETLPFVEMKSLNFLNTDQAIDSFIPKPDDDFGNEDDITISQDQNSEPSLAQVDVVMISNNDPDYKDEVIQIKILVDSLKIPHAKDGNLYFATGRGKMICQNQSKSRKKCSINQLKEAQGTS